MAVNFPEHPVWLQAEEVFCKSLGRHETGLVRKIPEGDFVKTV